MTEVKFCLCRRNTIAQEYEVKMIYLILAIASSAAISIIMRASEKYVKNEMSMFMAKLSGLHGLVICFDARENTSVCSRRR